MFSLPTQFSLKDNFIKNNTKSGFSTVISVDPEESLISFSSMTDGNAVSLTRETKKYKAKLYDEEFFKLFAEFLNEYASKHPSSQAAPVTLILPDRTVTTDVLNIPTLRRKQTEESLEYAINDLYKNRNDLKINHFMVSQNKQFTSFSLSIMQNSLLSAFYSALSSCKMIPQAVTYSSSAAVNTVLAFNSKLANASFMLMDIKASYTTVSFVVKGVNCGYFRLPFGYSILERNRLAAEDMLFDHSQAELLVLNAKEKAKAKQLTMMNNDNSTQIAEEMIDEAREEENNDPELDDTDGFSGEDEGYGDDEETTEQDVFFQGVAAAQSQGAVKTLPKKQPRKLPKFMLRPAPHSEEEYAYENFRIFVKWALNLVQANRRSVWQTKPDNIYVNLPKEYDYLFDKVNEEKKENGIVFLPLELQGAGEKIYNNLEEIGGFYSANYNSVNNF